MLPGWCGTADHAARKGVVQQVMLPGGVWCSRSYCREGYGAAGHAARRDVVWQIRWPVRVNT